MGKKGKKKPQAQVEQSAAPTQEQQPRLSSQPPEDQSKKGQQAGPASQETQPEPSREASGPQGDQPKKGKKGKQSGTASQETQQGPSQEASGPQGDQPKKGKKGQQSGPASQGTQPGPSQETSGPQGDQPKKGKKGQQPGAPSQGTRPEPPQEVSVPQGEQPKKGKKGQQPGVPSQGTRPEAPQEVSVPQGEQPKKGKKGPSQEQQSHQQRQQPGQGRQQPQPWAQQQQPPQQIGGQPGQQPVPQQQQRGQPRGPQQPPQHQQPPQQIGGQPGQQPVPQQQQQRGQPWVPQQPPQHQQPPQQIGGQPGQQPVPQQQQQRGQPWVPQQVGVQPGWVRPRGPPVGAPGYQQVPQGFPPGLQPGQIQGYPQPPLPSQQPRGPPPQRAAEQVGAPGYQQVPQGFPPGLQPGQIQGHLQPPVPTQQPRGPPPQRAAAQGLPQPPQTSQQPRGPPPQRAAGTGQQVSRPAAPPVERVAASVASLQISKTDAGDAGIVSQTKIRPGKKGRIIKVESNHLQLNLGSLKTAYHYDVNIVPDKPKKFMRPVVTSFIRTHFPRRSPAFDGKKNLYTSSPLTENLNDFFDDEVTIREEDNREKKFKVEIKFANKVDLSGLHNFIKSPITPQEALQVIDIVLRMAPVETCYPVGRSFFVKPERIIDLGQGMEMYHGFYQSAIRGWKPLLNVDVAHKAFPKDINVVDALVDLLNTGRQEFRRDQLDTLNEYQAQTLTSYIKTLRVNYVIPNHPESRKGYRVNGIGDCAQNAVFTHEDRRITIVDYFVRFKNYKIRYPRLPTLWVGNPQRPDKILLPLELCCICEGQGLNRKMTEMQTSKMIRHAATDTGTRKNKIMQGFQRANYNNNPCVREFGFSVGSEFEKLDARVLQPPTLLYNNNKTARVSRGVWRNEAFLTAVKINKWTIVNACKYAPRPDDYKRMIDMFERSARDCGMEFLSRVTEPFKNIPGRQAYHDIEQYFKSEKGKFDVIFVVVPDSGPQYSFVKKAAEISVGCLTQCIKSNTVSRKMNQQTAVNILLKVNSKLNGINHTFAKETKPRILCRPVMIMGADVTHPGPDSINIPSVAAVTASHDPKAFQYNICWRLQNPKMEIIEDLEAIVQEHLLFFNKKTNCKPEAILFFRDGVSEGQFEQVKNAEIRAIRSACKKLQKDGYEPKITFLVVQKRHHTRLFPLNPKDSEDRNMNVPAGTCVDTTITHPFMQDFYLVSHASIQGVAKPTKYCTLWDDNNLDNDEVEELAFYLCHMFSRCNRSVSYPAPTYYAHLAAARAKVYIENDRLNMDRLRQEFEKFQIKDEIRKGLPMFFV